MFQNIFQHIPKNVHLSIFYEGSHSPNKMRDNEVDIIA